MAAIDPGHVKTSLAANKMDLSPGTYPDEFKIGVFNVLSMVAHSGMNVLYLIEVLSEQVKKEIPTDISMISSARHYHALDRTEARLNDVLDGLAIGITHDFLAQDIGQTLYHLPEITGEISTEDVFGNIFGRLYIGN